MKTKNLKMVTLGSGGVGKTSLALRLRNGIYNDNNEATIGACYFTKELIKEKNTIKLSIWDTAGQERYRSLAPMYYRGANIALVVFNINDSDSYLDAQVWIDELRDKMKNINIILVGNKSDLVDLNKIYLNKYYEYSSHNNLSFLLTSAKNNNGMDNLKDKIFEISDKITIPEIKQPSSNNKNISLNSPKHNKCFCF